ncbi:transposase [Chryseobacterium sp. HR92]|uniref:transposase n=1 Tax=Chryseobacterium sp. HR92 TaxID=3094839 RepID=UPI003890A3F7|nr:helix-turn-helix domain-containing protein [Chryseobacterium sp. HR92]
MKNPLINEASPDYKRIYKDLLEMKYPEKKEACSIILKKTKITALDVIQINRIIFGKNKTKRKHRSYDKNSITKILKYQYDNSMTNIGLAQELGISRNTIAKWKKYFQYKI